MFMAYGLGFYRKEAFSKEVKLKVVVLTHGVSIPSFTGRISLVMNVNPGNKIPKFKKSVLINIFLINR